MIVRLSADTDRKGRKKGRLGPMKDLLLGYRYSRRHPRISGVLIITFIMNAFAFSYQVLLPVFVRDVLFLGPLELGILGAGTGIGSILGIALIDRLGQHYRDGLVFTISSLVNALATLIFAVSTSFPLSLIMLVLVGVGQTGFGIMQSSIVLRTSSDAMRPRVMGLLVLAIGGGPPGRLLVGGLAAVAGRAPGPHDLRRDRQLGVVSVLWRVADCGRTEGRGYRSHPIRSLRQPSRSRWFARIASMWRVCRSCFSSVHRYAASRSESSSTPRPGPSGTRRHPSS